MPGEGGDGEGLTVDPAALSAWADRIKQLTQLTTGMGDALNAIHQQVTDNALGQDGASQVIADAVTKTVNELRGATTDLHTALDTGSDGVQTASDSYAKTNRAATSAAESVKKVTDG